MIERILKHMNIYREMKNAAIPLNLIGKKGEDSCMNAARLVNQQELSSLMERKGFLQRKMNKRSEYFI